MITLKIMNDSNIDQAINKFKKMVANEGTIKELKQRQYFQKPSQIKHERNKKIKRKRLKDLRKTERSYKKGE